MTGLRPSATRRWDFAVGRLPWWRRWTPPQLFVASFALLIALGTLGFQTLPGLYTGTPFTWEESLFTATSAVCVTGLVVVDPATRLTLFGQGFLLLQIQLGGLGMITFTSLIIVAMGGRLSLRNQSLTGADGATWVEPRQLVMDVVRFTFAIELIGAMFLFAIWIPRMGWQAALWPAIFHSVSAFCNAGFSTFSDSMMGFQQSPATLAVIMALIVAGGLGFLTMHEMDPFQATTYRRRMSLQTRLILLTTVALILSGWLAFALLEWNHVLKDLPPTDRLMNALFLSVTARTAGFNSVDYAQAADSSNFLTILLMMIGGSPGSTAGGIKTTTFAVLGLLAWSRLRGHETPHLFGRSLREDNTDRAAGLFVIAFGIVTVGILLLSFTERNTHFGGFLDRMFEAVSAFNTVGVSTGLSPRLSSAGRAIIIVLMFVGRVGPLSFAAALARPIRAGARFRYAYEDVMVG